MVLGLLAGTANAAPPKQILFPVVGPVKFQDDWGAPRGSGRSHRGNDIMAARRSPVVAVEAGRIERPRWSSSDCALILHGKSGTEYWYLHLNNDLTRRDDNRGGCKNGISFARDIRNGMRVRAGQLIGYVGNSGNAAGGSPHLHFELHVDGQRPVSPYRWLKAGPRLLYAVPGSASTVRLALFGRINKVAEAFSLKAARIAVSRGWRGASGIPVVSLSYAPGVVVERMTQAAAVIPTALTAFKVGESVTVWTTAFAPTLATQLAGGNVLSAERIRLRGLQ